MNNNSFKPTLLVICMVFAVVAWSPAISTADDWNQWQGAKRDGQWTETGTIKKFPAGGPKVLWRAPISNGYCGPAVAGGHVYLTDFVVNDGDMTPNPGKKNEVKGRERVLCLDAESGKEVWKFEYDCHYKVSYPNGPRATPTIDGDRVYTLGTEGHLHCLHAKTGEKIWAKDLKQQYNLELAPHWGFAAHPLVHKNLLYCIVGIDDSVVVAFEKTTGKEVWRGLSARSQGYCPPTMITAGGTEQLLIWHPDSLNALNPMTGEVYWSFAMKPAYDMSIVAPVKHGDYLFATALQGTSILLKLDRDAPKATEIWRGKGVHPDHNPPQIVDNHIYGVDERGQLRCFDLLSGERKWESLATAPKGRPANSTTGFIVKNHDHYYISTEQGELIIAELSPEGYKELDRAKILEPTSRTGNRAVVWSHPAFADKRMFARNDKEIICISLAK